MPAGAGLVTPDQEARLPDLRPVVAWVWGKRREEAREDEVTTNLPLAVHALLLLHDLQLLLHLGRPANVVADVHGPQSSAKRASSLSTQYFLIILRSTD